MGPRVCVRVLSDCLGFAGSMDMGSAYKYESLFTRRTIKLLSDAKLTNGQHSIVDLRSIIGAPVDLTIRWAIFSKFCLNKALPLMLQFVWRQNLSVISISIVVLPSEMYCLLKLPCLIQWLCVVKVRRRLSSWRLPSKQEFKSNLHSKGLCQPEQDGHFIANESPVSDA